MKNALAPWRKLMPFSVQNRENPFYTMQAAFDRVVEDFYKNFSVSVSEVENLMITPSVDIVDNKDFLKIEAEVPGIGSENLKVLIADHVLMIKGEKKTSHKNKDQNYMMREITYGAYQRNVPLPESVDIEKAKATFKEGMLIIEMPKKVGASEQYKELNIESA